MKSPSKYRITSSILMQTISNWDSLMNFRVRLVGCGGTALTLLNIKESTKDIDDCIAVFATRQVDADRLLERYSTASLYDLNPEKMMQNFIFFVEELAFRNLVNEEFLEKVREYR